MQDEHITTAHGLNYKLSFLTAYGGGICAVGDDASLASGARIILARRTADTWDTLTPEEHAANIATLDAAPTWDELTMWYGGGDYDVFRKQADGLWRQVAYVRYEEETWDERDLDHAVRLMVPSSRPCGRKAQLSYS